MKLHTYSGSILGQPQVSEAIIGYLAQVGIEVDNRHFDDVNTFASHQQTGKLNDLVLGSWGSYSIFDADMLLHPLFHGSETLHLLHRSGARSPSRTWQVQS